MLVCRLDAGDAKQIEGVVRCAGEGGEDGGKAISPEADDIAGERAEIAKQGGGSYALGAVRPRPGRCVCGRPCVVPPATARP
jgi:hypothetical protein